MPDVAANPQSEADVQKQLIEDRTLITQLEEKWFDADRAARDTFRLWKENIAFIEGMQWIRVRDNTMLNMQGVGRNRIRLVDNRLLDHARRLHARLDQVKYNPGVHSDTIDEGDKMAAGAAESMLRHFDKTKNVPRERRAVNWWLVVCGQAYLESYFDPQAGPVKLMPLMEGDKVVQEPALDENGQVILDETTGEIITRPKMTPQPLGDVDFVVRSPFSVRRDPRFQDWRKLRYIFVEEIAAVEEVIDRFGEQVPDLEKKIPPLLYQPTPWMPELAADTNDMTGLPRWRPAVKGLTTIKRYYERPTKKFSRGRFIVYCGELKLYEGDLPTHDLEFPLTPLSYLGRPWYLEGKGAIDSVKAIQRLYNRILSRFAEHLVRMPAGWLLVPITSGIPKRAFTNEIGSVIRYVPGGGKPEFVFPESTGLAWYDRFLVRLETSMEERMALPPAVRGQLPKGARAARTVELLQEAADAIQAPVLSDLSEGWTQFYKRTLGLMHKHYTVARIISFIGDDKRAETVEFKGDVLPKDWTDRLTVTVEVGESLPSSKMMKIEYILTLAGKHGIFGKPGDPDYIERLGTALNLDAGFLKNDTDMDTSIAEDENIMLMKGGQVKNEVFYDLMTHLKVHTTFLKRLVLAGRSDDAQKVMPHWLETKDAVAKLFSQQGAAAGADSPKEKTPEAEPPGGAPNRGGNQPREKAIEPMTREGLGQG